MVRHVVAAAWNDPRRFEELEECFAGKALTSFKRLVRDRYLNPVDKVDANYKELCMLMPTDLGDHTYPGNKIRQYVDQKVKFMNFRCEDGRRDKPTNVLRCMWGLRLLGSCCQHLFGTARIFTDDEFKQVYWNIFPSTMQDWLTNDQTIHSFDPAAPLDVDEIADHLQRYWQLHFKNETQAQPSNNRNRNNKRGRDNDNQKSSQTTQNDSKKAKKDKGNKDASVVTNQTNSNYG